MAFKKARDDLGMYSKSYAQFVVPLVKATQELNTKLETKVSQLESDNKRIQQEIDELKKMMHQLLKE